MIRLGSVALLFMTVQLDRRQAEAIASQGTCDEEDIQAMLPTLEKKRPSEKSQLCPASVATGSPGPGGPMLIRRLPTASGFSVAVLVVLIVCFIRYEARRWPSDEW